MIFVLVHLFYVLVLLGIAIVFQPHFYSPLLEFLPYFLKKSSKLLTFFQNIIILINERVFFEEGERLTRFESYLIIFY